MKYKKSLLIIFLTLFIGGKAFTQSDFKALKGIKRILVAVEQVNEDAIKIGLTRQRIQTVVELKIRKEGIRMLEMEEFIKMLKDGRLPEKELHMIREMSTLYINVNVMGKTFSVTVKVREYVSLYRDKSIETDACTWERANIGNYEDNPDFIMSCLSERLDEFLNDYYKANPKKIEE